MFHQQATCLTLASASFLSQSMAVLNLWSCVPSGQTPRLRSPQQGVPWPSSRQGHSGKGHIRAECPGKHTFGTQRGVGGIPGLKSASCLITGERPTLHQPATADTAGLFTLPTGQGGAQLSSMQNPDRCTLARCPDPRPEGRKADAPARPRDFPKGWRKEQLARQWWARGT